MRTTRLRFRLLLVKRLGDMSLFCFPHITLFHFFFNPMLILGNCSKSLNVARRNAPLAPVWGHQRISVVLDRERFTPILSVSWRIPATAVSSLRGSQIHITDEKTGQTLCLEYSYILTATMTRNYTQWTFLLDGVEVQPEHSYKVSVNNLPKHDDYRITKTISIPGCNNEKLQHAQECRENGSLWQPSMNASVSLDWKQKMAYIVVSFYTSEYSEKYDVFLKGHDVFPLRVLKENRESISVTFNVSVSQFQCEYVVKIQPFFKQCKDDCWAPEETFEDCSFLYQRSLIAKTVFGVVCVLTFLAYLLWKAFTTAPTATTSQFGNSSPAQCTQIAQRKKLLIIYSLDHPLYRNIVLKLCSFLMAKCGTEVVLDMLDSTRLGMMGSIQWLEWHRQQIEMSSDKILILCSKGVQAKWRALCTGKQVQLREDTHSIVGDMLVPALCLMVPEFLKSASYEKYIIAYFDGVSTEDDVPSPFNITVRYRLMKQFEELFFRILDCEKHQMGKINRIEGLSEDEYHLCPTGRALRNAIEDFHAYQQEHPQWFEEELTDDAEMDMDIDLGLDSVCCSINEQTVSVFEPEPATIQISQLQVQLCA